MTLKKGESKSLISHIKLEKKRNYKTGDKVGINEIYLGDTLVHTEDIYAKRVEKKDNFLTKIKKWFKK